MPESSSIDSLDWSRLAEPQEDEYDTDAVLRLATSTTSAARPRPYSRSPVGVDPCAFDHKVAIRHVYSLLPEYASLTGRYDDAPVDHPNITRAVEHIRQWPVAFRQCQRLLEAVHPAIDRRFPLESDAIYRGSSSHSYERLFGTVWVTVMCPIGAAEAIVHEMAHQKLRVLGVSFESASRVVGNDRRNLYVSPVVKDRLRPMTAVLHAQYSYVYVTQLDIHILDSEHNERRRDVLRDRLNVNLLRILDGQATLSKHFEPGRHGREFMVGLSSWTERTIEIAERLIHA